MKSRIILFILTIIPSVLFSRTVLAEESSGRGLEIKYPQVPGDVVTPKYVDVGLPEYVEYIFRFSVTIIGFVIFGVLVYNGIKYLLSFGNPSKLGDAKQGIISGALGALVLLGALLIFNTINPQLAEIDISDYEMTKAYITPGIYICNKRVEVSEIIDDYKSEDIATRENAVLKLREEMERSTKETCFLVSGSSAFKNFTIPKRSTDWTIFSIPSEKYNSEEEKLEWVNEYGAVLHEEDNFRGRCEIFPSLSESVSEQNFYLPLSKNHPSLPFKAKAITVFKKPSSEPDSGHAGVTLYEGFAFNEIGKQEGEESKPIPEHPMSRWLIPKNLAFAETDPDLKFKSFRPSLADAYYVSPGEFSETFGSGTDREVRSIRFEPKGSFLAILQGDNDKGEGNICEVRHLNDSNLLDDPIGSCGVCTIWSKKFWTSWRDRSCYPCLNSLYVIKGEVL